MHRLAKAFSEQRRTIDKVIADGDTIALHCTHTGRHAGAFLPARHRTCIFLRQMHMIRFEHGKGAEQWAVRGDATLMRHSAERPVTVRTDQLADSRPAPGLEPAEKIDTGGPRSTAV